MGRYEWWELLLIVASISATFAAMDAIKAKISAWRDSRRPAAHWEEDTDG